MTYDICDGCHVPLPVGHQHGTICILRRWRVVMPTPFFYAMPMPLWPYGLMANEPLALLRALCHMPYALCVGPWPLCYVRHSCYVLHDMPILGLCLAYA